MFFGQLPLELENVKGDAADAYPMWINGGPGVSSPALPEPHDEVHHRPATGPC